MPVIPEAWPAKPYIVAVSWAHVCAVVGFVGHDGRGVKTHKVGRNQRGQLGAVLGDHRRGHHPGPGGLERRGRLAAPPPRPAHCSAVAIIHTTYGAADRAIDIEDGPSHDVRRQCLDDRPNAAPAEPSSPERLPGRRRTIKDPEPRPAYIRPELISGGTS